MTEQKAENDYTIDTREVFTVHKAGCAHTRMTEATFDVQSSATTRDDLVQTTALADYVEPGDDWRDWIAFAPCVDLP